MKVSTRIRKCKMITEWHYVKDKLPVSENIEETENTYYLILIKNYGVCIAMYCEEEWYTSYTSKVFREVIMWASVQNKRRCK